MSISKLTFLFFTLSFISCSKDLIEKSVTTTTKKHVPDIVTMSYYNKTIKIRRFTYNLNGTLDSLIYLAPYIPNIYTPIESIESVENQYYKYDYDNQNRLLRHTNYSKIGSIDSSYKRTSFTNYYYNSNNLLNSTVTSTFGTKYSTYGTNFSYNNNEIVSVTRDTTLYKINYANTSIEYYVLNPIDSTIVGREIRYYDINTKKPTSEIPIKPNMELTAIIGGPAFDWYFGMAPVGSKASIHNLYLEKRIELYLEDNLYSVQENIPLEKDSLNFPTTILQKMTYYDNTKFPQSVIRAQTEKNFYISYK